GWNTPMTCRVLFFLLKTHQNQIATARTMRTSMDSIRLHLRESLQQQRDKVGFNLAALRSLRHEWEDKMTAHFFDEVKIQEILEKSTTKRKFVGMTIS
ncbi:beta transducin, partial [Spiromyces aspiralis]